MFRRRLTKRVQSGISDGDGAVAGNSNRHDHSIVQDKVFRHEKNTIKRSRGLTFIDRLLSPPSTKTVLVSYFAAWTILLIRSYASGITAAGNETWYPVPLLGYIRSELALVFFIVGSVPFFALALGWTLVGVVSLPVLAIFGITQLVMPGPMPVPPHGYHSCGALVTFLFVLAQPFWEKPQAAVVVFLAISLVMPHVPEAIIPLFSSIPVEDIHYAVINYRPDILEDVGAAALESRPLLDFVWENRNDWVKVSHGRGLGYFVFGKNFHHDLDVPPGDVYSLRQGFRMTSYREMWGESDYRLYFPEKRREVSEKFRDEFGSSLANIYARVLDVDPQNIVLGDTGALAEEERMGFPAVKIVFPSLFWHWFNNPHTDNYLYQMDEIDGNVCDRDRQRTFLIPLTEPPGAGLYYWFKNGTRVDVDYKVGNVYSFEVSVLHAIRPFPYFEWSRQGSMKDARVTIQGFGIPCGDYWYITH